MKLLLPILLLAAGAAAWIAFSSEGPHRTRPDHRPAPATLASAAGPGEVVRNLAVEGMCCNGCAGKLHTAVMQVEGVREAAVDFDTGTVLARVPEGLEVGALEAALTFDKYHATARAQAPAASPAPTDAP
jgi:copper chaperone CopZ